MKHRALALITAALTARSGAAVPDAQQMPEGWLLWHSCSEYAALDSRLFLRVPDGTVQEIRGDFIHAMNGSFGSTPEQIVFMAIDKSTDEWDIYLYDSGSISNLTQGSGVRNEDPKWSPDGRQIVFKRGRWDSEANDFIYDLALLDLTAGTVSMLTDDRAEQAMPCFSPDGDMLYYAEYSGGIGAIRCMDTHTHNAKTIYAENGVTAYYPISAKDCIYFTKWCSAENRHDQIMRLDGSSLTAMPFNSGRFDCSDACPAGSGLIYSSTQNGAYDLFYYDGAQSVPLTDTRTEKNELGACFFPQLRGDVSADGRCGPADADALQKWLLAVPDAELQNWKAADLNDDGRLSAADLTLLKRELLP